MPILTDEERCGSELAGKYRIETVIGRGGMGVVFRGRHLLTARDVAIKILRPEMSQDATLSRRFVREARAASTLRHPNVVEVLDLGVEPDGTAYMVLELLDGEPLAELLDRKERLPLARTLELLLPVMDALSVAHEAGIVHRDLKPDNIFLAREHDGRVRPTLLDFGIAKVADASGSFATRTGSVMGTPHYMAPEQARGASDQGAAVDVWAIGVILYQCLSGALPFDDEAVTLVMLKVITEPSPRLDSAALALPEAIVEVVARAMAKAPGERFASMTDFVAALRDAAEAAGVPVPRARESLAGPPTSLPPPPDVEPATGGLAEAPAARPDASAATVAARPSRRPRPALDTEQPTLASLGARRSDDAETIAARPRRLVAPAARDEVPAPPPRGRWALALAIPLVAIPLLALGAWLALRDAPADAGAPTSRPPSAPVAASSDAPVSSPPSDPPPPEPPLPLGLDAPSDVEPPPALVEAPEAAPPRRGRGRASATPAVAQPASREPRVERDTRRTPGVVEW
ncbi:MAG: protein kinase [Sandaracinaceae bacterium]|nr:protein kinase [Sandaracinaceae bacterium]